MDEPAELPEGAGVELVIVSGMNAEERAGLLQAIEERTWLGGKAPEKDDVAAAMAM